MLPVMSCYITYIASPSLQILQPPKVAPNQARLIIVPETALELGKELGKGAFGTVYKVNYLIEAIVIKYKILFICV